MLRNFRALRKFSGGRWLFKKRDLLAPRRQERQVRKFNFFAAPSTSLRTCFAPLREIFRVLVEAQPRWASVVNTSSQETWNNLNENSTVT